MAATKRRTLEMLHQNAGIDLAQTLTLFRDIFDPMFKEFGISNVQYNVLRILRGAGKTGLGRNEIRDRLINRMPDVTRLLDRMEEAGLIRRQRTKQDRRVVPTFITAKGLELLDAIHPVLTQTNHKIFAKINAEQLEQLIGLLALVRPEAKEG